MSRKHPARPAEDQLLLHVSERPSNALDIARVFRAEDGLPYTRSYIGELLLRLSLNGYVHRDAVGCPYHLTGKGLLRHLELTQEPDPVFPVEYVAPTVSIMFRQTLHGWEGQVFTSGTRTALPVSSTWEEAARQVGEMLPDFIQAENTKEKKV
ncbi:hypothetical protein Q0M94_03525 [Deinococcus radiomollis]|uniref:hypothetical protein n=1 Tax=Deinococcus radiomollis TaxID=468916 RepID=UPI0038918BD3